MTRTRRFERNDPRTGGAGDDFRLTSATVVAVVGLGYWGPNLLRVLFETADVRVKYACDRDTDRLAKAVRRYPSIEPTTDMDVVLADPEVEAVIIATPVFTHFELASRALRAGKHTFVEKPLAASSAEADELVELAHENGCSLMCGHTFIYSPPVRKVKEIIDTGELGEIFFISSSRVNLGLHQRDVGVVWDLGPHDFSILLYWMGESPDWVSAIGRDSIVKGIPDVAFIDLSFPSGTLAHVELSWLAPSKLRRTVVVGSRKMVVYDDMSPEPVKVFDSGVEYQDPATFGQYQLEYRTGDIVAPKLETTEPLAHELDDFLSQARAAAAPNGTTDLARDVVRMLEASERSMVADGARMHPVSLEAAGSR